MASNSTDWPLCMDFDSFPWSDFYRKFSQYLNGLVTTLVCMFGCSGNLYSIHVVRQFRIGKALLYYLVTLALWDTGLLICAFCFYSLQNLCGIMFEVPKEMAYLTKYMNGPSLTTMTGSVWLVVTITIVRYNAVSNPLKHRFSVSQEHANWICIIISGLAVVYCLPYHFELTVTPCTKITYNKGHWLQPDATKLRLNPYYQLLYRVASNFLLVSVIPFLIIFVLTIRLIIMLKRTMQTQELLFEGRMPSNLDVPEIQWQQRKQRNRKVTATERHTNGMLLVLMGKFLICYFLSTLLNAIEAFGGAKTTLEFHFIILADFSNFLVVLNSATNAVVYFRWKQNLKSRFTTHSKSNSNSNIAMDVVSTRSRSDEPLSSSMSRSNSFVACKFSLHEKQMLLSSWQEARAKKGDAIGVNIVASMISTKNTLASSLNLKSLDFNSLSTDTQIQGIGSKLTNFFDFLLNFVADVETTNLGELISKMVASHRKMGIHFSNDVWILFKKKMTYEVLDIDEDHYNEMINSTYLTDIRVQKVKVWNQLLSMLVGEIKRISLFTVQNEKRLSLNEQKLSLLG